MPDETPTPPSTLLDLVPDYLPTGQAHFLSGPPAGGKTAFVAGLVRQVLDGAPLFDKPTHRPPMVACVSADRRWDDSRRWYDVAGVPELPYFSIVDSGVALAQLRKPAYALQLLEHLVLEQFALVPGSLLIIDPISYWAGQDMNRYLSVWLAMIGLNRLCKQYDLTILGLAHTGKQKADSKDRYTRPQDRINGSAALLGCSGTQMALETPDQTESDQYRFTWVPHHAPAESIWLERTEEGLFRPAAGMTGQRTAPLLRPDVLACIPAAPADPISPKAILKLAVAAHHELSRPTLFRCLRLWAEAGLVYQPAPGLYLRTPVQ